MLLGLRDISNKVGFRFRRMSDDTQSARHTAARPPRKR
jgi:hypothetical protein